MSTNGNMPIMTVKCPAMEDMRHYLEEAAL
jgi:hypothetical protein